MSAPVDVPPSGPARERWDRAHRAVVTLVTAVGHSVHDHACGAELDAAVIAILDANRADEAEWTTLKLDSCHHFDRWLAADPDFDRWRTPVVEAVRAGCFSDDPGDRLAGLVFVPECSSSPPIIDRSGPSL